MKQLLQIVIAAAILVAPLAADDPHRPRYHFLPPANWMNDTMGIYWQGEYHIFYLHNPHAPIWRQDKHWAHAVSKDLVNWTLLPPALWPLPGTAENLCCQTGSLVVDRGTPTAVYTCAPGVCLATSRDNLRTWERHERNPVVPGPPPGMEVTGFRDPYVWQEGEVWYLLMASGTKEAGGTALLYQSGDLRQWEYLGPLLPGEGRADAVWEVPSLFPLGGKAVFLYSPTKESRFTRYFLGAYSDGRFKPESKGKLDSGGYFYAATTFVDAQNRRVAIGWLKEGRSREAYTKAGWSGCLSLPRVISLRSDGRVASEPVRNVEKLRGRPWRLTNRPVVPGKSGRVPVRGAALEILAEFDMGSATDFGLKVLQAPDGEEETVVGYDAAAGRLYIDASRASRDPEAHNRRTEQPLALRDGKITLRVFVDHSVVEVFADGAAMTARVYPSLASSRGVAVFANGGQARLLSLNAWEMRTIW